MDLNNNLLIQVNNNESLATVVVLKVHSQREKAEVETNVVFDVYKFLFDLSLLLQISLGVNGS